MNHLKNYNEFKENRRIYENSESVNEEFLGKLIGGIKNLFKKAQERINKTKGGKEVEVIYQKYITMITTELAKTAQIDLNVAAASKGDLPAAPGATTNDANAKLAVDTLKKKKTIMDQIVQKIKSNALKEMDAVLTKFGGAAANPQLKIVIDSKKDQFEMDYLNAQIAYLDKAGDKTMIATISKERDALSKKIEDDFKDFDTAKVIKYEVGDEVIYLLKDKKPEEYNKDKKPEDQKNIVGVHKIAEIDGDNFTLEDEKGQPTIKKTGKEIMGKVSGKPEYKVGDAVIYLLKDKKKEDFDKLTDDEKKKPTEGKAAEIVGVKKIEKIDGDRVTFLDKEGKPTIVKTLADIMGKSEGGEVEEDLTKTLGDVKSKNPEAIGKLGDIAKLYQDPVANKDKIAEIEKQLGGE